MHDAVSHSDSVDDLTIGALHFPACIIDASTQVLSANSSLKALIPAALPLPWSLSSFLGASGERAIEALTMSGGKLMQPFETDALIVDAQDRSRWFLLSVSPLANAPTRWLCTFVDIDRLKSREEVLRERNQLLADLLDATEDCIKLVSPAGDLLYMNAAGCRSLGVSPDSGFGMAWLPLLPERAWAPGKKALAAAGVGVASRFVGYSELPDEGTKVWDNALTPLSDAPHRKGLIVCLSRDITEERAVQDALRASEQRLAMASRVAGLGIWDFDLHSDRLYCDATWHQIVGADPERPVQSIADFRHFIHLDDVERVTNVDVAAELAARQSDYTITFRIVRPSGEIRWVRSAATLTQDASGEVGRAIGFMSDITDAMRGEMALRDANRMLQEERDSLAQQCMEDPLTRLANRRFLGSELARVCLHAERNGGAMLIGMIDIDFFKAYNDRYGHVAGDKVLCDIADALKATVRRSDFIARYGGEEFAFIFQDAENPQGAVERLRAAVEALAISHKDSPFGIVTISCGCVVRETQHIEPTHLLEKADEALYAAKAQGRNRVVIMDPS